MTGWVKVFRSLTHKGWYQKSEYVHLWLHLLLKANHREHEFWFNGQNVKVKKGQLITGRKQLSIETGISEGKIERILKCFKNEQQIEQQTNNRNRLISVLNYQMYQQNEQQTNNKRTTSEQQADTYKNKENKKNTYKTIDHLSINLTDHKKLLEYWKEEQVDEIYESIANHAGNKKYKSLYLTAKNWLKRQYPTGKRLSPLN